MNNPKKYKRTIVITAVLAAAVCLTAILANAFAAERKTRELQALSQQGQDSNRGIVLAKGGSAQAGESTAANTTEAQPDGLATDKQPDSTATNIQPGSLAADKQPDSTATDPQLLPAASTEQNQDKQAVRALVEGFGKKLSMVSLLAPKNIAAKSIEENYAGYVTPELLRKWMSNPQSAPGRMVSSPWPDHIGILNVEAADNDQYTVYGEIFEVTSAELVNGGAAAKRPATITVRKTDGRWLISDVSLGEYSKRGPVKYENKQYGFDFYLPESWKGYKVVEEKWEGRFGENIIETGPQLLIRNPAWTDKEPYQDIPIMVFTTEQWNALQNEKFYVSAAPIGPSVLGSNSEYVFALPPRYNYAFPKGFEEVEKIMSGSPLWPIRSGMNC
ncbi:MAG TPA: hypothetical protein VHT96_07885 [Clostridia bacterium]|nr:hypothetical protein [Clostridia bacterium]